MSSRGVGPDLLSPPCAPQLARLNCISDLLSRVQYTEIPQEHLSLPSRDSLVPETQRAYKHPPAHEWNIVPQIYTKNDLVLHDIVGYESFDEARGAARLAPVVAEYPPHRAATRGDLSTLLPCSLAGVAAGENAVWLAPDPVSAAAQDDDLYESRHASDD